MSRDRRRGTFDKTGKPAVGNNTDSKHRRGGARRDSSPVLSQRAPMPSKRQQGASMRNEPERLQKLLRKPTHAMPVSNTFVNLPFWRSLLPLKAAN